MRKNKQIYIIYIYRKRKLTGYSPTPGLPYSHGVGVHLCNKKFRIFKLKEFFKFMLYAGFAYLVTRKLTRTPGSVASLHCFSGEHLWLRLLIWSLCPYSKGESPGRQGSTILETFIPYFRVNEKKSP